MTKHLPLVLLRHEVDKTLVRAATFESLPNQYMDFISSCFACVAALGYFACPAMRAQITCLRMLQIEKEFGTWKTAM